PRRPLPRSSQRNRARHSPQTPDRERRPPYRSPTRLGQPRPSRSPRRSCPWVPPPMPTLVSTSQAHRSVLPQSSCFLSVNAGACLLLAPGLPLVVPTCQGLLPIVMTRAGHV